MILGGTLAFASATFLWLGRSRPVERPRFSAEAGPSRELLGEYIGSRTCGECHPVESARYPRSGHANTLRPAADLPLARRLDGRTVADPETPGVSWSYDRREGDFLVERREGEAVERHSIDYAFGSGHHATTFLTLVDPSGPTILEHRLSHYSDGDRLEITPGQSAGREAPGTTTRGREPSPKVALKCFRCHSTRTSAGGERLDLPSLIPNVSCERCHGPARKHVEDARAGRANLEMPFAPGTWTAESQLKLCGECHRHPSQMPLSEIRPDNKYLARFQPIGLSLSPCYKQSAGALSCVTCHDPHARVSSRQVGYEQVCLGCHESASSATCPVSPRDGCIGCHMPKVDSGQHVAFTDHWIRARPGAGTMPASVP